MVGEVGVLGLQDLFGGLAGGDDDHVDLADADEHEGAVLGGKITQRLVGGLSDEVVDVANDGQPPWAGRERRFMVRLELGDGSPPERHQEEERERQQWEESSKSEIHVSMGSLKPKPASLCAQYL